MVQLATIPQIDAAEESKQYVKDFEKWNKTKQNINGQSQELFCHLREVWFCSIGVNVGEEEDGKNATASRPVLIVAKFGPNLFLGVPMTSKEKIGQYYFTVQFGAKLSVLLLSQIRVFDRKRLLRKMGMLSKPLFIETILRIARLLLASL